MSKFKQLGRTQQLGNWSTVAAPSVAELLFGWRTLIDTRLVCFSCSKEA